MQQRRTCIQSPERFEMLELNWLMTRSPAEQINDELCGED